VTTPAKRKGDTNELEVAKRLADLTGWPVKRKLGAGRQEDTGDLHGLPETTAQVKAYGDVLRAIREGLPELRTQQANANTPFGALMVRRPRQPPEHRWMVVMDLDQFATLLREATTPDQEHQ
jgi:hypothetical protein